MDSSQRTPLPGAGQLPLLVESFRRAGAPVSYDVRGDPAALPDTLGLTLYRILQEALTNTARHAPGADVEVRLSVGPDETVLSVVSAGPPGVPNSEGVGLQSMSERAAALGGHVFMTGADPALFGELRDAEHFEVVPGAVRRNR